MSTWTITYQRQKNALTGGGRFAQVMEIGFTVQPSGVDASIDVPLAQYNAENVKNLIDAYVAHIDAVHNLS